jgi:hypothetical protein
MFGIQLGCHDSSAVLRAPHGRRCPSLELANAPHAILSKRKINWNSKTNPTREK